MFVRVCEAVAFAHAHGVVHRDLKPENIMVAEFGEVLVLDWGIARLDSRDPQSEIINPQSAIVNPQCVAGTPHYMAPEQASGDAAPN